MRVWFPPTVRLREREGRRGRLACLASIDHDHDYDDGYDDGVGFE